MPSVIENIRDAARASNVAPIHWADRGPAPIGYVEGMAVSFGRVYCKLKANDPAALVMAQAASQAKTDALAHYAGRFAALGMANGAAGVDTLRHLFVLMMGLGMRESSGKYCEGRDYSVPEGQVTASNAEAGLFQSSYDLCVADPLLQALFATYRLTPSGLVDIFRQGSLAHRKVGKTGGWASARISRSFRKIALPSLSRSPPSDCAFDEVIGVPSTAGPLS